MKIFDDNSLSIGNTPLVRINKLSATCLGGVYVKVEGRNPAYSVKCRIGASMIWDAEEKGILKKGMEVIEPTSGNTGIGLAYVCAARGYKLILAMPETMSVERRKVLAAFGAKLMLTPGAEGMKGAIGAAEKLATSDGDRYFMPMQFRNPANPAIHEKTTGPEIWRDTDGQLDVFIAGVGTGGTLTGTSRFLKSKKDILSVAVEPAGSPVIAQALAGKELVPGKHGIQGIGAGFIPDTLDLTVVDRVESVTDDEAIDFARRMAREEGIICGISSGAAVAVACRLASQDEFAGKNIVCVLPDSGERYLSTDLYSV